MKYDLKVVICILSVDFYKEETYILSENDNKIIFPSFELENLSIINSKIKDKIKEYFIDPNFIEPYLDQLRFLSLNDLYLSNLFDTTNCLYLLFGLTLPNTKLKDNIYWTKFDFTDTTIPNELAIIGATVEGSV